METYGKILLIAMPIFLLLVLFEKWYGRTRGEDNVPTMDMISSLSSGLTNVTKDVLGLSVSIIAYQWLVQHIAVYHIETTFWVYFVAFMTLDFRGYWEHRWAHEINFFWNKHAIHHSSEEYNLACALRQSISAFVNIFTFLLIPAALLGVDAKVIATIAPLHLFAQFWYHTKHIDKMGFLETFLVTPSHHRVHHSINPEYMDKNYSQIFIFWDKLFGTFQEELHDVPPVYGISRPSNTWNPIKINFQHLGLLMADAWRTNSFWDKIRIWFMPTGWRPSDVEAKYPVNKITDVFSMKKYETNNSSAMQNWVYFQFSVTILFIFYFFGNIGNIGTPYIFIYGGFIFLSIYSYTELMDLNPNAWIWETLKNIYGFACIYYLQSWFGLDNLIPFGTVAVIVYLFSSILVTGYFVKNEIMENRTIA